jgi:hypothetical protein
VPTYLLALALILSACKGKPKPQAAPPGSARVETQGSANSNKDIPLPHSDGSPPVKTTGPVKPETLKKLSEMTFPGWNLDVRGLTDKHMWVYQKTPGSPVIRASIHIWPCDKDNCWPIDLDKYKARQDDLKKYLTDKLKAAPDTQWEVGKTDVNGTPVIYTFQLGEVLSGEHNEFSYAYVLYYNDGQNEIRVIAEYKDDLVGKKEDMVKLVPREDLENTAKAFLDVYTHHWQE